MSYKNSCKDKFLSTFSVVSIEQDSDTLTSKCKFNFAYFEKQTAGKAFSELTQDQLVKLLDKIRFYSCESLNHWKLTLIGKKNGRVLKLYPKFPNPSDFEPPKHVPHQAIWGRFRLEYEVRLVGFVIPDVFHGQEHRGTQQRFDCNTFYVVFYDDDHGFYKGRKKS